MGDDKALSTVMNKPKGRSKRRKGPAPSEKVPTAIAVTVSAVMMFFFVSIVRLLVLRCLPQER